LYCPHLKEVDDSTLQQLFSKVAAVRSENRELFDFTHREIEVFRTTGGQRDVVSESKVYAQFNADTPKNFAVVIEGEVGTGKSELCASLAHRLKDEGRPLLHVNKEDDLMTLLSDRLPKFYREQFGEEMEGAADFQQLRDDIKSIPQVVANSAVSNAILNLSQRGYDISIGDGQEAEISNFIEQKLDLLVEKGEYATQIQFVSEQEYNQSEFLQIFDKVDASDAVEVYNEELWRVVRDRYETASLSEVLKRVGTEFTDTRPVIVFEDFSITAMEAGKLASFIESDQTESPWDFIIAGTRDSTGALHTQTAESRYEFYQTNETNSQSVLFLDRDSAVDFIRPYLGYFKSFDGSVKYDRNDDTYELLPAPSGSRCSECGLCDEEFRDLFPFNEPFLRRIYAGMEELDQESPREYVMTVFEVLSDYYEGTIDIPSGANALKPLVNRISISDRVYSDDESFVHLAKWYGQVNDANDTVEVDRRFAEAFGLIGARQNESDLPESVGLTGDTIVVPASDDIATGGGTGGDGPSGDGPSGDGPSSDEPDSGGPEIDPVQAEFEDKAPLIQSWQNTPSEFRETSKYLERGLEDAIARLTDDYALFEGTSLEYQLSSEKRPFVFSSTEDTPDGNQITVDPEEFRLSDLRSVLRFGIEREKTPRNAGYDDFLEEMGTQLTAYARAWRDLVCKRNLEDANVFYTQDSDYGFEDFALATYSYAVLLDSPWQRVSAEAVCERFDSGEYSIDDDLDTWLKDELEHEEYEALESIVDAAPYIEELVDELFGVSGSDLDRLRVQRWLDATTPQAVLSALGRNYIKSIDSRVHFGSDLRLRDLADTAYDVESALSDLTQRYQREPVQEVLENLDGLSMTTLDSIVSNLDTYEVDPDVMEPLKRFNRLSQSNVDRAVTAASMARDLQSGHTFAAIQAALASAKLQHSTVYERYEAVPLKSGGQTDGIGRQFKEVAKYYVE
jgi:hypothetical protein